VSPNNKRLLLEGERLLARKPFKLHSARLPAANPVPAGQDHRLNSVQGDV
jgi:hypothetical protein